VPNDVEPPAHQNKGNVNVNSAQYEPYASKEYHSYTEEYQTLKDIFQELFDWLRTVVRALLYIL